MDQQVSPGQGQRKSSPLFWFLETVTAFFLLAVLVALSWIILAAYRPGWARLGDPELEVILVVGLLSCSLILVCVVALLHTRTS